MNISWPYLQWLSGLMHLHVDLVRKLGSIDTKPDQQQGETSERAPSPPRAAPKPTASIAPVQKQAEASQDVDMAEEPQPSAAIADTGSTNTDVDMISKDNSSPIVENGESSEEKSKVPDCDEMEGGVKKFVATEEVSLADCRAEKAEIHRDDSSVCSVRMNGVLDSEKLSSTSEGGSEVGEEGEGRASCQCSVKSSASQEFTAASAAAAGGEGEEVQQDQLSATGKPVTQACSSRANS